MTAENKMEIDGRSVPFSIDHGADGSMALGVGARKYVADSVKIEGDLVRLRVNGFSYAVKVEPGRTRGAFTVEIDGRVRQVSGSAQAARLQAAPAADKPAGPAAAPGAVSAPMPGKILEVFVQKGRKVNKGDVLLTLEAMKMENRIEAPAGGEVAEVKVSPGQAVGKGDALVIIKS